MWWEARLAEDKNLAEKTLESTNGQARVGEEKQHLT
jgi:hypothetical protein